jgi:hypothetical protein
MEVSASAMLSIVGPSKMDKLCNVRGDPSKNRSSEIDPVLRLGLGDQQFDVEFGYLFGHPNTFGLKHK